jgi:hypothetical protein
METIKYSILFDGITVYETADEEAVERYFKQCDKFLTCKVELCRITTVDFVQKEEQDLQGIFQGKMNQLARNWAVREVAMSKVKVHQDWLFRFKYVEVLMERM